LKPITELSKLVQSLEKAEKERMHVLVLAKDEVRKSHGDEIKRILSSQQP